MALNWSLQHKRDTAANWTANNPTLLAGQLGIETDTLKIKVGTGVAWNSTSYRIGDISVVLGIGNDTGGLSLKMNTGTTYYGATNQTHVTYNAGIELHNTTANKLVNLSDAGLWKVDATQYMPNLTGSRLLSLDSNKYIVNETGTGILTLNAGVISYDTNTYLTTSAAALAYQPLDSDLTSWAGVTRASGFDTFTATPSSANLSSLLTDKTGTGVNVFGTSPTFTTDITTPLIIGGSIGTSKVAIKSTTGTSDNTDGLNAFEILSGVNGNRTVASFQNNGNVIIGGSTNTNTVWLKVESAGGGINQFITFQRNGSNGWGVGRKSDASFSISYVSSGIPTLGTNEFLNISNTGVFSLTGNVSTSGAITNYSLTIPANTGQTASTEIPNFKVTGNTKTWATGALATQRFNYFSANTAAAAGASTFTAIHNFYSDAPLAGSNMTATNLYAAGFGGHVFIANSVGVPSNNPTGGGILYVEAGALKYRGSSGTVTTLGAA